MCILFLDYNEAENLFLDEWGEVVYDLYTIITPGDLFLFHNNPADFNEFPMVDHPEITVMINYMFAGEIHTIYSKIEQHERRRKENVAG